MAQVGCLGDIIFQVSSNTIKTVNNAQWSGSARYSEHQRHLTNSLTEFTGIDPDKFTFDIELSMYLGVDPMDELSKIWNYERTGKAVPLVIGEKSYGKYRWAIKSHKIKLKTHDKNGNLTSAVVSIELLEYLKK